MTRALSLAALLLVLAGCSSPDEADRPEPSAAPASTATSPTDEPAASGPGGCDLVTAEEIETALGTDPGECSTQASNVGGPDSGHYEDIGADVQVSDQASVYFPDSVCSPGALDGAVEVPGADRGYAVQGAFCVVKGERAVYFTAFVIDPSVPASAFQTLAEQTLAEL